MDLGHDALVDPAIEAHPLHRRAGHGESVRPLHQVRVPRAAGSARAIRVRRRYPSRCPFTGKEAGSGCHSLPCHTGISPLHAPAAITAQAAVRIPGPVSISTDAGAQPHRGTPGDARGSRLRRLRRPTCSADMMSPRIDQGVRRKVERTGHVALEQRNQLAQARARPAFGSDPDVALGRGTRLQPIPFGGRERQFHRAALLVVDCRHRSRARNSSTKARYRPRLSSAKSVQAERAFDFAARRQHAGARPTGLAAHCAGVQHRDPAVRPAPAARRWRLQ